MAPQNPLPIWGNERTMNLNSMILTNIQSSPYFKVQLYELKTYHEVIDEIFYRVEHLEPWEKGSRKTSGQTGMCGGVRGVGAGGIVSSAFCLLYKLFTLKLTKKQVIGLITHQDSPYIRGLGFMYIRYTQPPPDLWDWYVDYIDDEEEIDVKAGGGVVITIGEMVRQFMLKLEWYSTLFPRIPVPVQKILHANLKEHSQMKLANQLEGKKVEEAMNYQGPKPDLIPEDEPSFGEAAKRAGRGRSPMHMNRRGTPPFDIAKAIAKDKDGSHRGKKGRSKSRERHSSRDRRRSRSRERNSRSDHYRRDEKRDRRDDRNGRHRSRDHHRRSRSYDRSRRSRSKEYRRSRSRDRSRRSRSRDRSRRSRSRDASRRSRERSRRSRSRERGRSQSRERRRSRSRDRHGKHSKRESSFEKDLRREKERQKKRTDYD